MDFVIGLLESEGYNAIIMVINRLIKIKHFIPIINEVITQDTIHLFIENIYKYHGFPKIIISN